MRTSTTREQSLTFAEFGAAVDNAAARLAAALQPGERVLVQGAPGPGFAAALFAAARANVILVPLDARMTPDTVERISDLTRPSAILLGTGATLEPVTIPALAHLPVMDLDDIVDPPGPDAVAALAARATAAPDEPIEILCTSGSTGNPKGVTITQAMLLASTERCLATIPAGANRFVSILPLSHIMEQVAGAGVRGGGRRRDRVHHDAPPGRDRGGDQGPPGDRARRRPAGPGAALRRHPPRGRPVRQRRHVPARAPRRAVPAGGAAPAPVQEGPRGAGRGAAPRAVLGRPPVADASSAAGRRSASRSSRGTAPPRRASSRRTSGAGRRPAASAGPSRRSSSASSPTARSSSAGRRSSPAYWEDPAATAAAFTPDGWYRTGDIGEVDASGSLRLVGRTRSLIALPNGMNVHPEDVEAALVAEGLVEPVVYEAEPGRIAMAYREGAAFSDPPADEPAALAAAVRAANRRLADHQRIAGRAAYPEADFPRTHTRKVRRSAVAERMAGVPLSR